MPNNLNPVDFACAYYGAYGSEPTGVPTGTIYFNTTHNITECWNGSAWVEISNYKLYTERQLDTTAGAPLSKAFDVTAYPNSAFQITGTIINESGAGCGIRIRLNTLATATYTCTRMGNVGISTQANQTTWLVVNLTPTTNVFFDYTVRVVDNVGYIVGNCATADPGLDTMVRGHVSGLTGYITEILVYSVANATGAIIVNEERGVFS